MLPGKSYTPLDFARMAWRRRWTIALPAIVGAYVALVASSYLHDKYRSETLIQVVPQRVPDSYVQSTVTMRTEDRLYALSQQVLSRTALEDLIVKLKLYEQERQSKPMQDVVEAMRKDVAVDIVSSRAGQSADAFFVRFSYSDPELATVVTTRLGRLFIDMNARDRGDLAEATDSFLQSQLAETRRGLEEKEKKLEQFRQRNSGRLPTQLTFNMQAIQSTQLAVQALVESLARDRDRKLMLERLFNDARTEAPSAVASVNPGALAPSDGGSPSGALPLAQQVAVAREGLARLELRLKPEHPDIARAKRVLQDLEKRLSEEAASSSTRDNRSLAVSVTTPEETQRAERLRQMRAEIESLDRQIKFKEGEEQRQRTQLADYQRRIEEVPGVESEWTALTRDYDTQQVAYKDLLTKSEQSKVSMELERRQIGEQFKVLDPARRPVRPTGIRRLQVNGAGVAVGLFVGLALAALLELRDRTFKESADISEVLKLPVLALVPYLGNEAEAAASRRRSLLATGAGVVFSLVGGYGVWALQLWKFVK